MSSLPLRSYVTRGRINRAVLAVAVLLASALALGASRPRTPAGVTMCGPNDAAMAQAHAQFMAAHPALRKSAVARPAGATGTSAVTATFTANGFLFDADGNPGTQVDVVTINQGESVQWNWISGLHDAVSGNPGDIDAGSVFFLPLDFFTTTEVWQFDTPGTYPFFCDYHAAFGMAGVIVVKATAGVGPNSQIKAGFSASPWPNPSLGDFSVRFAVAIPGRAQVRAYDASGRAVATLFDRDVTPGTYSAAWTGRSGAGERLAPGAYFLRLAGPGVHETRQITIVR